MKYYDEKHVLIPKGEHIIFLPEGTKIIGYEQINIDDKRIKMVQNKLDDCIDENTLSFINTSSVIVRLENIVKNIPGITFEEYEKLQEKYIFLEPLKHEVCLPYCEIINPDEIKYFEYDCYEPISLEFEKENTNLWDSGYDDKIIKYKMYANTKMVAIKRKNILTNIIGISMEEYEKESKPKTYIKK